MCRFEQSDVLIPYLEMPVFQKSGPIGVSPEAAFAATPETTLLVSSTFLSRAPGGGPREQCAGNANPSARESKNVAGAPKGETIRREIEMGSSNG